MVCPTKNQVIGELPVIPIFVGIDVACANNKPLPICFARHDGDRLVPMPIRRELLKFPRSRGNVEICENEPFKTLAADVVLSIKAFVESQKWKIQRIAIDAPAAMPKGKRNSEQSLGNKNISYFKTPDCDEWQRIREQCIDYLRDQQKPLAELKNANRIWMLYGFELFKALRDDYEVREVYPNSIVHIIAHGSPSKKTSEGYKLQLNAISERTNWKTPTDLSNELMKSVPGAQDDKLDAFMCAWIASLRAEELDTFGDRDERDDCIWVPKTKN